MKKLTIPKPLAILATLQTAVIILKLCNFLTASWIAILAPSIGPLLVLFIIAFFAFFIYIFLGYDSSKNTHNKPNMD